MAVNIVKFGNETIMDISDTTAEAADVASGKYFYNAAGVKTEGTSSGSEIDPSEYIDMDISGMNVVYSGQNLEFTGASGSYIDTGVALFSEENINKDFKLIIRGLFSNADIGTDAKGVRCVLAAMYEVSPYPGFVLRSGANTFNAGSMGIREKTEYIALVISRTNGVITAEGLVAEPMFFKITGNNNSQNRNYMFLAVGSVANITTVHNTTLTLGCEKNAQGKPYRYCHSRMESIVIALGD